jgi:hypothetical protein
MHFQILAVNWPAFVLCFCASCLAEFWFALLESYIWAFYWPAVDSMKLFERKGGDF